MFRDLPYELRVVIWLVLPVLFGLAAPWRSNKPVAAWMAGGMAGTVGLYALWATHLAAKGVLPQPATDGILQDTYYVVSPSPGLAVMAVSYLVLSGLTLACLRLASSPRPRLPSIALWIFHLGAPLWLFPMAVVIPLTAMLRRYADYPAALAFWNYAALTGVVAIWLAMLLLVGAVFAGLVCQARARNRPH